VCTEDAEPLGTVGGVLIDPEARRLAYLVLESPGFFVHRRYLLPFEAGAAVDNADSKTLRIWLRKDQLDLRVFKLGSVPHFSDGDLAKPVYSQSAASAA
jgi:hypothetical protein